MQHLVSSWLGDTFASVIQPNSQKCEWLLSIEQTTILAILPISVSKAIEFIEEMMLIANSLWLTINWSDGCPSQFKFYLVLLNYFQPNEDIEWQYNEPHHGERDMDDISGTAKNQVFHESKSWKIILNSLHDAVSFKSGHIYGRNP